MKALFAGSFDPFTVGHKDIIDRALPIRRDSRRRGLQYFEAIHLLGGRDCRDYRKYLRPRAESNGKCIQRSDSRFCQRIVGRLYSTSHSQRQRFRVWTGFGRGQPPTVGHRDSVYVFVARTVARVVVDGTRACKLRQRHKPLFAVRGRLIMFNRLSV